MSLLRAGTHVLFGEQEWKRTWFSFFGQPALSFAFHFLSLGKYEYRLPFSLAVKRIKEKYVRSESRS